MEVNYSNDSTSSVQFQVIPPDVAEIPLPDDISEIPLPNSNIKPTENITSEIKVDPPSEPIHIYETASSPVSEDAQELNFKDVTIENMKNLSINDETTKTKEDILSNNDLEDETTLKFKEERCSNTEQLEHNRASPKNNSHDDSIQDLQNVNSPQQSHNNIDAISTENEQLVVLHETKPETIITKEEINQDDSVEIIADTTQFEIIPPEINQEEQHTENLNEDIDESLIVVESQEHTTNVLTEENQNVVEEYVETDVKTEDIQADDHNISEYSVSQIVVENVADETEHINQSVETEEHGITNEEMSKQNKEVSVEYMAAENAPVDQSNIVEYVVSDESVSKSSTDQTSEHHFIEYVESDGNEKEITSQENQDDMMHYIVAEENVQSEQPSESTQHDYIRYVISDDGETKVEESTDQPGYIEYVVSKSTNDENIVQYVVTSSASDTEVSHQENSENYVGYIVQDDEKVEHAESSAEDGESQVTYEVVEDDSHNQSEVVIEEMEVEEMPEISNDDQNEDIEIYVIEDADNMQTVIEVHVENSEGEQTIKAVPDLVPMDTNTKTDSSSSRKRPMTGNYIEVVDEKGDTTAKLPCHVLGRNLKNPEADVLSNGRNPPKARPGVKVPPMSLMSCIVTSEEISEEIDNKLKADKYDKPKGGDILFKHKITKRLAEKLCTTPGQPPSPAKQSTVQHRVRTSPNTRQAKKNSLSQPKPPKPDHADLLAILEGDEDPDWSELKAVESKDQSPPILQAIEKSIISGRSDKSPPPILEAQQKPRTSLSSNRAPLKLDSEEKRRLAKHQLMNLPHVPNICSSRPRGRPKLTDYNPLKQTLLKNAGMAVYTTPRSKDPPKTYSNKKANDIIRTLVSDWEEESQDGTKTETDAAPEPSNEVSVSLQPIEEDSEPPKTSAASVSTEKVIDTVKQNETITANASQSQAETKNPAKAPTTVVTTTSSNTKIPTPASSSNTAAKRKSTPVSSPQIGIVPNKIARIIKKKVIWDPDNPQVTYSSTSPSINGTPPTKKKEPTILKKEISTPKKEILTPKKEIATTPKVVNTPENTTPDIPKKPAISTPHPKKLAEKQQAKLQAAVDISMETVEGQDVETTTEASVKKDERRVKKFAKMTPGKVPDIIRRRMLRQKAQRMKLKSRGEPPKKKKLTEIDRLLMDEGAVNMIYAVERSNNNAEVPEIVTRPNKRLLISLEKERRNLLSKANIIKQAVLRHSASPNTTKSTGGRNVKPLRLKKGSKEVVRKSTQPAKKKSDGQHSTRTSVQSPTIEENPDFSFTEVNESRIIRRHSSSSYSSTCTSPRRLSIDLDAKPGPSTGETPAEPVETTEKQETENATTTKSSRKRQKGVPIFVRPPGSEKTYKGKTKPTAESAATEKETRSESVEELAVGKEEQQTNKPMNTRSNRKSVKIVAEVNTEKPDLEEVALQKQDIAASKDPQVALTDVAATSEAGSMGIAAMVAEEIQKLISDSKNPPAAAKKSKAKATPKVPEVEKTHNLRKGDNNYKEISIRRHEHLVQIILTPSSSKFKNSLNLQTLRELREILIAMSKDVTCRVILLTSSGSIFCHGLDYSSLLQGSLEKRRHVVKEMVDAVIELLRILAAFPKILVAGVHGAAIGLGVTMLPLFDLVLASDKATFSVPATKHGYIPEGTSLMPWHRLLGHSVINELVLACRELTASEALQYGLVTRILWPDKFHADLIPTVKSLTSHSTQAMVVTKAMLRQQLLNGLDDALDFEEKQLFDMWTSSECQESFKTALADGLWE